MVSASPRARFSSWCAKRARWSSGSLSSEKALACSRPRMNSSNRSTRRGAGSRLRQRRDLDWTRDDERRPRRIERPLAQVVEGPADKLPPGGARGRGRKLAARALGALAAEGAQRLHIADGHAQLVHDVEHGNAGPGPREVDLAALIRQL